MLESAQRYGVPPLTAQHAARPRLTSRLDAAPDTPLVLVSAPAGTGKTSLVAEWLLGPRQHDPTAWVTFDASDTSFWPAVAARLERLGAKAPAPAGAFTQAAPSVDRQVLLGLTSAVARLPRRVTLVLDGYDLVDPGVAHDLDFLLRHSGHRLRLVLVTRADPVLPLYRYRLDETVTELRTADLAFTDEETAGLLRRSGVTLSPDAVHLLGSRTAGWAVGLRFAARILAACDDPERCVVEVTAEGGHLAEYLRDEVLDNQTPEVRRLLLRTSVPDTLRPGLTEVLAGPSGTRTLALLTRSNAFVDPDPERPGHYRYQPFFRDLLRAELAFEAPEQLDALHRRAAAWFAGEGLLLESVRHFVATDAWEDAAAAIVDQLAVGALLLAGPDSALARAMANLPAGLRDPAVCVVRAVLALADGDRPMFEEQLDLAARQEAGPASRHDRALALSVEVLEVLRRRVGRDLAEILAVVDRAQHTLLEGGGRSGAEQHPELTALVLAGLGRAEAGAGRLTEAYDAFAAASGAADQPGAERLLLECLGRMAVLACFRGQVSRAETLALRAVDLADELGIAERDRTPAAPSALAWVGALREDLRTASEQIAVAQRAEPLFDDPVTDTLFAMAEARLNAARGDLAGALELLGERSTGVDRAQWLVDRLRLEAGRLRVVAGEPDLALLELADVRTAGTEAEVALVTSQAFLARGGGGETFAPTLRPALRPALRAALRPGLRPALRPALRPDAPVATQVGAWLVEAARQLRRGSVPAARSSVDRALRLASVERLRLPFRLATPDVRRLLRNDVRFQAEHGWLTPDRRVAPAHPVAPVPGPLSPVVETLTGKEMEVLGHLAELLTTEEIAAAMFVSVNTIRTHVRSILRKLGVSRRNAAVRRAKELALLPG